MVEHEEVKSENDGSHNEDDGTESSHNEIRKDEAAGSNTDADNEDKDPSRDSKVSYLLSDSGWHYG